MKSSTVQSESNGPVGKSQDLRAGSPWFDHRLDHLSFRELMIVIATGIIPFSSLSQLFRQCLCGIVCSGFERILCGALLKRTPGKNG